MVYIFENVMQLLTEYGFFAVILPWLLIFAIVYGILMKTGIFGDDSKNVSAIVSLAIAFFVVAATNIVEALQNLIPAASYLIVAALLILIIMGFFFKDVGDGMFGTSNVAKGIMLLLIIVVFLGVIDVTSAVQIPVIHEMAMFFLGTGGGAAPGLPGISVDEETLTTVAALLIMLGVIFGTVWFMRQD